MLLSFISVKGAVAHADITQSQPNSQAIMVMASRRYKLMKPVTSTQKDNVLSLLKTSTSYRRIAAQTGVSRSKVAVLAKEAYPAKENLPAGCPKKLSSVDEHAIIKQIS